MMSSQLGVFSENGTERGGEVAQDPRLVLHLGAPAEARTTDTVV